MQFDDTCWPLVVAADTGSAINDVSDAITRMGNRGHYALLLDRPRAEPRALAAEALQIPSNIQRNPKLIAMAGIQHTALMRNSALALYSVIEAENHAFFEDDDSAIEWCRSRVADELDCAPRREDVVQALASLRRRAPPRPSEEDATVRRTTAEELPFILELFGEPAFLVRRDGSLLYANRRGRESHYDAQWLAAAVSNEDASTDGPAARVLRIAGEDLLLVTPISPWEIPQAFSPSINVWPPRLRETVSLLLDGRSDREVAEGLQTTLATARTYVIRVFRLLGVRGRKELMALRTGSRRSSAPKEDAP